MMDYIYKNSDYIFPSLFFFVLLVGVIATGKFTVLGRWPITRSNNFKAYWIVVSLIAVMLVTGLSLLFTAS